MVRSTLPSVNPTGNKLEPGADAVKKTAEPQCAPPASTPADAASRLVSRGGLVWLDSSAPAPGARSILAVAPDEIITGDLAVDAGKIQAALLEHRGKTGGLFGWIGFDGRFVFGVYPRAFVFDHDRRAWLGDEPPDMTAAPHEAQHNALHFQPLVPRAEFTAAVRQAQRYIAAGDIYQVNLSCPWRAAWPRGADALSFYHQLRAASPAPFAAFADLAGTQVCSASPECFLRMCGRRIETRPIKGTRPRFPHDSAQDAASAGELLRSEKERAELLMITDLERNDLGQVCEFGSIAVPELWRVERFAQVFHLVSTVTGTLRAGVDHVTALRACFPGGSITGAPKKRALEIIAELEHHQRGIYTGAIGHFGFNGESQFSIAIRTAVRCGDESTFHVGAGIVADSVPEREYEETLHKAAGILDAARSAVECGGATPKG